MTAILAAIRPFLLPLGIAAVFLATLWITYNAGKSVAYADCAIARATAERKARAWYEDQIRVRDAAAARERERADDYRRRLIASQAAAAQRTEELKHALAKTDLRRCDARKPARVLRDKADRIRRDLSGARTRAGRIHGVAGAGAGDARRGRGDGRNDGAVG